MTRQPDPPNNPFGKLLEMGFERPEAPSPPPAKKAPSLQPKAARNSATKPKPAAKAKSGNKKKPKKAKKTTSAQSFRTSLPNARNLTAAGTKKPPPYQDGKTSRKPPAASKPSKKRKPSQPVIRVKPMIKALPKRTMSQLQGHWLNCLRMLEDPNQVRRETARKFLNAILAEWGRRCKLALSDPDYFDWPSTQAGPGDRSQRFDTWNQEGVLKYMGYEVGKTKGLADHSRREILDAVFSAVLPPVNSPDYVKKWGLPGTASRLERLANELARFARNGKRNRTADYSAAVADWEADLKHLHRQYYIGKFNFGWPSLSD